MVFRVRPKRQFGSVHPNRARLTRHPTRYTAACLPTDLFGRGAQKREDVTGSLAITAPDGGPSPLVPAPKARVRPRPPANPPNSKPATAGAPVKVAHKLARSPPASSPDRECQ